MRKRYPATFSVLLYFTDESNVAEVRYSFPVTKPPTEEDIATAYKSAVDALPEGFRALTYTETLMHHMRVEKGYRGARLAFPACDGKWMGAKRGSPEVDRELYDKDHDEDES